jgi:DNA-binding MarR family transcriptional regulator
MSQPLEAGPALIRVATAVTELYDDSSAKVGLTTQQARLLFVVARRPTNMLGLSSAMRLTKSTMTGVIDRLENAGLISRIPDPHDRRQLIVTPTALGAAKALEFEEDLKYNVRRLVSILDPEQSRQFAGLLSTVLEHSESVVSR